MLNNRGFSKVKKENSPLYSSWWVCIKVYEYSLFFLPDVVIHSPLITQAEDGKEECSSLVSEFYCRAARTKLALSFSSVDISKEKKIMRLIKKIRNAWKRFGNVFVIEQKKKIKAGPWSWRQNSFLVLEKFCRPVDEWSAGCIHVACFVALLTRSRRLAGGSGWAHPAWRTAGKAFASEIRNRKLAKTTRSPCTVCILFSFYRPNFFFFGARFAKAKRSLSAQKAR